MHPHRNKHNINQSNLKDEIIDVATKILAKSAPQASQKLVEILNSDDPIPQVNAKLQAAQTLLDRVGVAKRDKLDVTHNVGSGIFILPEKKPTIEAEDVEVIDEDCGYTLDELNELDSYTEEAMYLESVGIGDDAEWGVA